MELGLYTFADMSLSGKSTIAMDTHQRIHNLLEEIKAADEPGRIRHWRTPSPRLYGFFPGGNTCRSHDDHKAYQTYQNGIPVWVAAGGTPASAVRAAQLGVPLALAIIGGKPEQFVSFTDLYRTTALKAGQNASNIQLGINSHVYVADDSKTGGDEFYPSYAGVMNRIGKERGWLPLSRIQFEQSRSPRGALVVGSPQQVIDKILFEHELFGNTRFLAQMSLGDMPHQKIMKSIELFATKIAPAVKKALSP